jgi:hypothetical protein
MHPNMTLRDYLIAHAPDEPQAWFVVSGNPTAPEPIDRDARSAWSLECYKRRCVQWPGAWADAQIALRPADERAYLFALTVADADGAHAYAISKVAGSLTEARALAIAAAVADRGGFGVEPLECELVQRIHVFDGEVFIRMGLLA